MAVAPQKPKLSAEQANQLAKQTPQKAGMGNFALYIERNMVQIKNIASRELSPERLYRMVLANVSRTPLLAQCTIESLLRATLQAAELGLAPGSATGEAYLVPFKKNLGTKQQPIWGHECQLIPGYRGLIALAFRSGHVTSVKADVVYQGDGFKAPTNPLDPQMEHVRNYDGDLDPKNITFAYCVVRLKDGGLVYDVMSRGEIDAVRARSKSSDSGPWVTDFAEMAKKTVARRCLKYAPMSAEMSKALAADSAAETGDNSVLAEFEMLGTELVEEEPEGQTKTEAIRDKIPEIAPEGSWPSPVFGTHDAKLQTLGMEHKEAADWAAAGVTEAQAKLALTANNIEGVREKLDQAVNK